MIKSWARRVLREEISRYDRRMAEVQKKLGEQKRRAEGLQQEQGKQGALLREAHKRERALEDKIESLGRVIRLQKLELDRLMREATGGIVE